MSKVRLSFGEPDEGWLSVSLESPGQLYEADVSDVPHDSLRSLVEAVSAALDGLSAKVDWHLEPAWDIWTLARTGHEMTLEVHRDGAEMFSYTGDGLVICRALWRGLRRLEVQRCWAETPMRRFWSSAFPTREMSRLSARLRKAQSVHSR